MAFGNRKNRWSKAAHIKSSTKGTSNELSFSVLDATKQKMDAQHGEAKRISVLGKIQLFTVDGTQTDPVPLDGEARAAREARSPESGATPVAEEKKQRRKPLVKVEEEPAALFEEPHATAILAPRKRRAVLGGGKALLAVHKEKLGAGKAVTKKALVQTEEQRTQEASRRKRRRKTGHALGIAAGVACVVFALCIAGYYAVNFYETQQRKIASVENIQENLAGVDSVIALVDEAMADPTAEGVQDAIDKAQDQLSSAEDQLEATRVLMNQLEATTQDSHKKQSVREAAAGLDARLVLLQAGEDILSQEEMLVETIPQAKEAWEKVLAADTKARTAADTLSSTTGDKLDEALEQTEDAISQFQEAKESYNNLANTFSGIKMGPYTRYIEARVKALNYVVDAIGYLKKEKTSKAESLMKKYRSADEKAVERAKKLPSDYASPLLSAYEKNVESLKEGYAKAAEEVQATDALIRYL